MTNPYGNRGKFPQCESCINRQYDPFQCLDCKNGSNYEPPEPQESDDMTYDEFLDLMRMSR